MGALKSRDEETEVGDGQIRQGINYPSSIQEIFIVHSLCQILLETLGFMDKESKDPCPHKAYIPVWG